MTSALLLREPHLGRILNGTKTWEIRGSRTQYRGRLVLARSGSGLLIGECRLIDVKGPLSLDDLTTSPCLPPEQRDVARSEGVEPYRDKAGNSRTFAWVLSSPVVYEAPIPYRHPQGAVIFVKLSEDNTPEWFRLKSNP